MQTTYPCFLDNYNDLDYLKDHFVLTPKLDIVDLVNSYMLYLSYGEPIEYYSLDSISKPKQICQIDEDVLIIDMLNKVSILGLPNHKLSLKVRDLAMLPQNIDQPIGLYNGIRIIIT